MKNSPNLHVKSSHLDQNTKRGVVLSDVILGGQDGLVNTLGVILGIAAASSDMRIVVAGGLAGAIAEAVSMGAVAYTSNIAERDYYVSQLQKEKREIQEIPEMEIQEIRDIYAKKGFEGKLLEDVVKVITSNEKVWLETMMQEELKLNPVEDGRPLSSALLVGISSLIGALIPLLPFLIFYFTGFKSIDFIPLGIYSALIISAITLFIVGVVKSKITIGKWYKSGTQMVVIGILSALVGFFIGKLFQV